MVGPTPWTEPGWLSHTLRHIDACLHRLGRARTGPPVEVKHWSVSAVLRVPATGGPVWYKAVPPVFAHEGRVIDWVRRFMPAVAPPVLAFGDGWLLTEEMPAEQPAPRGHPITAIIALQQATAGMESHLLRLGCPDRRPRRALAETAELARRPELLGVRRCAALAAALPALERVVSRAATLRLPDVLVHGDLNGENSRWTDRGWVTIDWTDASLAHPVTELAQPLIDADQAQRDALEALFAAHWAPVAGDVAVREALRLAPALGAAHQAGTYRRILDQLGLADDHPDMLRFWVDRLIAALTGAHAWNSTGSELTAQTAGEAV